MSQVLEARRLRAGVVRLPDPISRSARTPVSRCAQAGGRSPPAMACSAYEISERQLCDRYALPRATQRANDPLEVRIPALSEHVSA